MKIKTILLTLSLVVFSSASFADNVTSYGVEKIVKTPHICKAALKKWYLLRTKKIIRKSAYSSINDFDDIIIDDDVVLARNRRAQNFGRLSHENGNDLSDFIKIRLALARIKALKRYKEMV